MDKYDTFKIENIEKLKRNTIYFFLKENSFSEHFIKTLRKNKDSFLINGKSCLVNQSISNGDVLQVLRNPETASSISACDGEIEILYEDEDYLIVNKPHLLACIPTRSHYTDNLGGRIVFYMKQTQPNFVLRILNRLDKDTAGIVIVAKSVSAYNNVKHIHKTYFALCSGIFSQDKFTINKPILTVSENGINKMKRIIDNKGKSAITNVEVERQYSDYALVKLNLETGRTHQIRVHLASEEHHLLGDHIYSPQAETENHTFLILKEVSFTHYKTNKIVSISVPLPSDWEKYLKN